jgi:hypothetical protein
MGTVIPFPRLREITCLSVEQTEIRDTLIKTMGSCTDCAGTSHIVWNDGREWFREHCPCGGSDENRIDLNETKWVIL